MITPQFKIEDALASLLTPILGLNVLTSNRTGARLFPYATIKASIGRQYIVPYSGVFEVAVEINYSDSAARTTQAVFDATYYDVFSTLYANTNNLALKVQNNVTDLKVFMGRITSQTPTIRADKRAWQRGLTLSFIVTPDANADGLRNYNFSEIRNSFYLVTI
jgi:hypothetical protein